MRRGRPNDSERLILFETLNQIEEPRYESPEERFDLRTPVIKNTINHDKGQSHRGLPLVGPERSILSWYELNS